VMQVRGTRHGWSAVSDIRLIVALSARIENMHNAPRLYIARYQQ
jgi:hypothetical protein